jgi:hypothetical protein
MTTLLSDLAPIDAFPTVDEVRAFTARLAAQYPDRVVIRDIGRSRQGDPIQLVSIEADSSRGPVLVIGQPHPNEPIGMATIIAMCERLASDPAALEATGASWHFVPCADPDGTRLNEGWFAGPWTREHYARNFYRPASDTQVEWTFPFSTDGFTVDAPMPETRALMTAIDEVHPVVAASLHNGELGGAYYYATSGADDLYPQLADLCVAHDIPLHMGDPETPLSVVLAPAVYSVPTARQIYDLALAIGADPAALVSGGSSLDYALQYGPIFGLAIELPYWRDERAADTTPDPSGASARQVMLDGLDLHAASEDALRSLFDSASPLAASPFADAVGSFLSTDEAGWTAGQRQQVEKDPSLDRPATVAEVFSTRDNLHMFRLRLAGMLLRAVQAGSPAREDIERTFDEWCAEAAADNKAEPIPIRDLVAVQAGAILATAHHVLSRKAEA